MSKPLFPLMKTSDLADVLGISRATVARLVGEGVLTRVRHGLFDGPASIRAFIARLEARRATGGSPAREQILVEQLRKLQRENLLAESELCDASEVRKTFDRAMVALRAAILPMASRVARNVAVESDPGRIVAIMESEGSRTLADAESALAGALDPDAP